MNANILVVDDEPLVLKTIERALTKVGYSVKATSTVDSFFDELNKARFDLLIMDVHVRGTNLSDKLLDDVKNLMPDVKVLRISGSITAPDERGFLQKPFKIDELRSRVRELLDVP